MKLSEGWGGGITALALAAALIAEPAQAIDWPEGFDQPPSPMMIPPGLYICTTLDAAHLFIDDIHDANVPVPAECGKARRAVPVTWELVEHYDGEGFRYWVVKITSMDGQHTGFTTWMRKPLDEVVGLAV